MTSVAPLIIQGGMGAGVSSWHLAKEVSRFGHLGVVSGTGLDQIFVRRLQIGDPGGDIRRAMAHFPFQRMAKRLVANYFIPGGKEPSAPFRIAGMHTLRSQRILQELCIASNFTEVFLAREGHDKPVGINYLEKIQLPHLPSLYGAMLAGVSVVIIGAGIPFEIPGVLDSFTTHQPASYPLHVTGTLPNESFRIHFDPGDYIEDRAHLPAMTRPLFWPIVASDALASILLHRSNGKINGFVIEGPTAGGHNAPPRGKLHLTPDGQPIYGPRDVVDLEVMRSLKLPFWLAGSYGSPEQLRAALAEGATGIQVGTAFALCRESCLTPELRQALIQKALEGKARVFTDPVASPAGFPFKVAELEGTLSDPAVYQRRKRKCDLGFLREPYRREDGSLGYRCAAELEARFVAKGGKLEDTINRKCLCNSLVANIGMPQVLPDGSLEKPLVTLGDDFINIGRFCDTKKPDYTVADVIRILTAA